MKIYISYRDAKGQMRSADPFNMPANAPESVARAAEAVRAAEAPKRGRGRPVGYRCAPETVARMVAGRIATLAARKGVDC